MSFASNQYMVNFQSGHNTVYVGAEDVQEVLEYCAKQYANYKIKEIYKEVYCNFEPAYSFGEDWD